MNDAVDMLQTNPLPVPAQSLLDDLFAPATDPDMTLITGAQAVLGTANPQVNYSMKKVYSNNVQTSSKICGDCAPG